ncbi:uncharacterized protein [Typha latifolia]|uniref:uncharacterized protein isoform X1 n=2 Tax=Typha latifolia TaxID=4733 RepID=UPI003C2F3206
MLIQSSLPDTISTVMPFSNHAKEENMDPSYDWSHFAKTWQKSSKCDERCQARCRKCTATGSEEKKFSCKDVYMSTCSDISAVNDMCTSSVPKQDGYVYKRRKLQQNGVALLSEDTTFEYSKESAGCYSSISSEDHNLLLLEHHDKNITRGFHCTLDDGSLSLYDQDHPQDRSTTTSFQVDDARADTITNHAEDKQPLKSARSFQHASENISVANDRYLSPRENIGHPSDKLKNGVEDSSECSSSSIAFPKPPEEFTSEKELCIFVLKSHGLLGAVSNSRECASLKVLGSGDSKSFKPCKICGILGNPLKMFICDLCEEAFHVSCCDPRFRNLPADEWCCQPCSKSRPVISCYAVGENSYQSKRTSYGDLGPILFMLRDDQPYTSGVRIGRAFQAEVPEWSGPFSGDSDYFSEPSKLDPAQCATMDCWKYSKPAKVTSIGNWVQCQDLIYTSDDDEGTICGKWRRAPLFVVQSDDWDCSCAMLWDPIHADCAVPQELDTEVVLKHLKYIEMLRPRLSDNKRKLGQSKKVVPSNDSETIKGDD